VSDTEAENEVHAALTEALKHTETDDDSALEYAGNIMDQWRSLGLLNLEIELDVHQDQLLTLHDGLRMAYVDTCGSKCYVRDGKLCIDETVRPLKSPIKVKMGKGHSTASKIGIMKFHLKAMHHGPGDNPHDYVYTVLLPVLICDDFDTDIIILSGPMLNQSGFGIGPMTNYIASTKRLRAYPVDPKWLIDRRYPRV